MKIVFTAEHAGDLSAFHQLGELLVEGWALGKPKLSAGQLIELAHDAEVLVTSYDGRHLNRKALCTKLLSRLDRARAPEEESHYQTLIGLLFAGQE